MSYRAKITGWVGRLDGSAVLLVDGQDVDPRDALVVERPDLIEPYDDEPDQEADVTADTDPEPAVAQVRRPRGRKTGR